jgi:hypothetical protein
MASSVKRQLHPTFGKHDAFTTGFMCFMYKDSGLEAANRRDRQVKERLEQIKKCEEQARVIEREITEKR